MKKHYKSKIAAIAVGTAIKVLTGVVCGAVVLTGTYGVVKHTVLPNSTAKTQSMFAYEGEAGTGGTGGSAADSPVYQTELKRNGVIPAGGVYTLADGTQLTEGDDFPVTPVTDDTYEEGDYKYTYGYDNYMMNDMDAWSVEATNKTKTSYGQIISEVAGKEIKDLSNTFYSCTNLVLAPAIPSSTTIMWNTFNNCTSLTTAPTIPESVTIFDNTFKDCTSLTGNININMESEESYMNNAFEGTLLPITINGGENADADSLFYNALSSGKNNVKLKNVVPTSFAKGTSIEIGDYKYTYISQKEERSMVNEGFMGWNVKVINKNKQSYGEIESDIVGLPVLGMIGTFSDCTNLKTIPQIPSTVKDISQAFENCTGLTNINITLAEHIESFAYIFNGCYNLKGNITVNTDTTDYAGCLFGVTGDNINISGSSSHLNQIRSYAS